MACILPAFVVVVFASFYDLVVVGSVRCFMVRNRVGEQTNCKQKSLEKSALVMPARASQSVSQPASQCFSSKANYE